MRTRRSGFASSLFMQAIYFNDFKNAYIPEILKELYRDAIYKPYIEHLKDATIVDCGGNIGLFTMYVQPYAKKIVTIEPAQSHYDCITEMCRFNDYKNVDVFKGALSNKTGESTLNHNQNSTMYSLSDALKSTDTETVKTITVKDLFETYKLDEVDFFKLDVEGHEYDIITSKEFEEYADRIKTLVVEWHSWTGRTPDQLATTLFDYGYDIKILETDATVFAATRKDA